MRSVWTKDEGQALIARTLEAFESGDPEAVSLMVGLTFCDDGVESWAEWLGLDPHTRWRLRWADGASRSSQRDADDWQAEFIAEIESGVYDVLFEGGEDDLDIVFFEGRVEADIFGLVRYGVMPVRCARHMEELVHWTKLLGPILGILSVGYSSEDGVSLREALVAARR